MKKTCFWHRRCFIVTTVLRGITHSKFKPSLLFSKNWKNTSYIFQSRRENMTLGGIYLLRNFTFMDLIISYFITSNLWEESVLKNLFCLFSRLKIRVIFSHVRGKEDFIAYYYCTERSEWDLIMCIFYDEHIIGSSGTRLYLCKHTIYISWLC